jgi:hypothetical protein
MVALRVFGLITIMVILTAAIFVLTKDILEFGLCLVAYIIFMMLLQRLFSSFKYSFSYGEGCLFLQSLIVFCIKSILRLLKF